MICKQTALSLAATTAIGLALAIIAPSADAAEVVLSGSIKSAAGEKIEGITVSAKAEGGTITTTVFTDETGAYYFPPLEAGKYKVWAQALSFEAAFQFREFLVHIQNKSTNASHSMDWVGTREKDGLRTSPSRVQDSTCGRQRA